MNDEGRDGVHAKPYLLVQSAGNRCSLVRYVIQIHSMLCFAAFLCVGSSRV
jgi:hypothetical protein